MVLMQSSASVLHLHRLKCQHQSRWKALEFRDTWLRSVSLAVVLVKMGGLELGFYFFFYEYCCVNLWWNSFTLLSRIFSLSIGGRMVILK